MLFSLNKLMFLCFFIFNFIFFIDFSWIFSNELHVQAAKEKTGQFFSSFEERLKKEKKQTIPLIILFQFHLISSYSFLHHCWLWLSQKWHKFGSWFLLFFSFNVNSIMRLYCCSCLYICVKTYARFLVRSQSIIHTILITLGES